MDFAGLVAGRVVAQEGFGFGVLVGGGDVGAACLQDQARQADPTTHLEDMTVVDRLGGHEIGQYAPRGPQHAKYGPTGRRDAGRRGCAQRVAELLPVHQRAQPDTVRADLHHLAPVTQRHFQ